MKNMCKDKKVMAVGVISLIVCLVLGFALNSLTNKLSSPVKGLAGNGTYGGSQQNGGKNMRQFGGGVNGEIVSLSASNLVIKSRDGGSRIVLISPSIEIAKNVSGTSSDLVVGAQVMVSGAANSDGSINANMIQIRPASSTFPGRPAGN